MERSVPAAETEIDLGDGEEGEEGEEGEQPWATQLKTVPEDEEDEASTQSDTRPLINERDPRRLNECLKVSFGDVIAEPPPVRSSDGVWVWSATVFELARVWIYRVLALLLAVPLAAVAGVAFAALGCLHVWFLGPCAKAVVVNVAWLKTLWGGGVDAFVLPVLHSASRCCGSLGVRLLHE